MNLLFITQKVDKEDDILGIYHRWLEELAGKVEKLSVICLYKGSIALPDNVEVFSLGKERLAGWSKSLCKLIFIFRFYKYIFRLRKQYETVFIHMNPEYVILGGLFWKLLNKNIVLWYAHYLATFKLKIAALLSDKIVTSVRQAYPLESKKLEVLQQGIDTEQFKPDIQRQKSENNKFNLLFLGRISPTKDLATLIKAFAATYQENQNLRLSVVGSPTEHPDDIKYYEEMKFLSKSLGIEKAIIFSGRVPNHKTSEIYNQHDLFVNLTRTGSFDKTTLEAMACGSLVLTSNRAFLDFFPPSFLNKYIFGEKDVSDLSHKILSIASMPDEERKEEGRTMRRIIDEKHNLPGLISKLLTSMRATNER